VLEVGSDLVAPAQVEEEGERVDVDGAADEHRQLATRPRVKEEQLMNKPLRFPVIGYRREGSKSYGAFAVHFPFSRKGNASKRNSLK